MCIVLKEGLIRGYVTSTSTQTTGVVWLWCCWIQVELKRTCKSLNAWTLEKTRWTVLIIPVGLCCQVPAVVDVIILLLDLQAVEVCGWDGAHGVRAGGKHIQPTDTEQRIQSAYSKETQHPTIYQIGFCFGIIIFLIFTEANNTFRLCNDDSRNEVV